MFAEESQVRDYLASHVDTGFSVEGLVTVGHLHVERLNGHRTDDWLIDCFRYGLLERLSFIFLNTIGNIFYYNQSHQSP